tara:strand:+ start:447 stop:1211 length:765 start_codon:yes stop_codon:yes gene_type:complete
MAVSINTNKTLGVSSGSRIMAPQTPAFSNTKSLEFDGVDDRVNISNSLTTTTGTYSLWVKPDLSNDRWFIVSSNNGYRTYVGIRSNTDGTVQAGLAITHQLRWRVQTSNPVLTNNVWSHIALVHNGTQATLFIDGVQVPQSFVAHTPGWDRKQDWWAEMSPTPTLTRLGVFLIPSYSTSYWKGYIDEVSIYTTALTQTDITAIYNTGAPDNLGSLSPLNWLRFEEGSGTTATDSGSGGNDGTLINGTSYSNDVP